MKSHLVARFRDGRTRKGISLNVDIAKPTFHLRAGDDTIEVRLADLKALFFVKNLAGNSAHNEATEPTAGDPRLVGAKKIAVTFDDGEMVVGMSNRFPPAGTFFFMLPIDPNSNNVRILVNRAATVSITQEAPAVAR
jgi:hypothetical protein